MRKSCLCLLILLLSCSFCFAAEEFSFRGVTWGMSRAEVKAVETGNLIPLEDVIKDFEETAKALQETPFEEAYSPANILAVAQLNLRYTVDEPIYGIREGEISYTFKKTGEDETKEPELVALSLGFTSYGDDLVAAVEDYKKLIHLLALQLGEPEDISVSQFKPGTKLEDAPTLEYVPINEITAEVLGPEGYASMRFNNPRSNDFDRDKTVVMVMLGHDDWFSENPDISIVAFFHPPINYRYKK